MPPTRALAVLAGLAVAGCATHAEARRRTARAPAPAPARVLVGRSVRGRPIAAVRIGDAAAPLRVLVVGAIHGDERAGIPVARRLQAVRAPAGVAVWSIADLNPDGAAAHTRQNAHGVDLNRNFPWRWRALGPPGTQQYSGPHALSEPEARAAAAFVRRLRPAVTIWFHQPLGLVDESGGDVSVERRFARLAGLPLRRLTRYPGSAAGWQDHVLRGTTAFVVELPPGRLASRGVARCARAVLGLARALR